MALVCVTAFKGRHKFSEHMGEQGVCGEMAALLKATSICGTSHGDVPHILGQVESGIATLCTETNLLSISNNLEQETCDNSVEGDGPSDGPTPLLHENDVLPFMCPTKS